MKRNVKIAVYCIFAACLLGIGCWGYFSKSNQTDEPQLKPQSSQQTNKNVNPLTGLPMDTEKLNLRPVCIMTNNLQKGQPMSGISDTDIMYECLIEGGITRILSVFKDINTAPNIGSVRSARPYFISLAKGLNGVYIHLGGSYPAYNLLKSGYIDSIDLICNERYMWRDADRRKNLGFEHSAFTSGEKLVKGINDKGYRTVLSDDYNFTTDFSENSPVLKGDDAHKLTVKFSGYKSTIFEYDQANKTYLVSQFNKPQMDGNKNIQNSKPNVVVIRAETSNVDNTELLNINLVGSGQGYYMSHGKIVDLTWSRQSDEVSFKYTTKDGQALSLLPGQFYFCVITPKTTVTVN